jgi:hypothetical protein
MVMVEMATAEMAMVETVTAPNPLLAGDNALRRDWHPKAKAVGFSPAKGLGKTRNTRKVLKDLSISILPSLFTEVAHSSSLPLHHFQQ